MMTGTSPKRNLFRRLLTMVVVTSTAACGKSDGTGPGPEDSTDPGFISVTVTGPVSPDVAFKFRLAGNGIDSLRNASGTLYFETLGPALHRVIVIDAADRNRIIEFWIPDRNQLDQYGVNLEEVASTESYANLSVASYIISLLP